MKNVTMFVGTGTFKGEKSHVRWRSSFVRPAVCTAPS